VLTSSTAQRIRWLILLSLVGLLLIMAPEPTDTVAIQALQQGSQLSTSSFQKTEPSQTTAHNVPATTREIESAFLSAIARRPIDPEPWRLLGDFYVASGRPDDARAAYGQALRRGADSAALDGSLAQLCTTLSDLRKAQKHWTQYLARRPDDRGARLALALTSIGLADWERARAQLEHLLTHDTADLVAHAWLGLLLVGPQPETGLPHLERSGADREIAVVLAPLSVTERQPSAADDPAYRATALGAALLNLDTLALQRLSEPGSHDLRPVTEEAIRTALSTLALRSLLIAVNRSPDYADAFAYLGQALDRLGRSDWAQAALQHALRLAPESPVAQTLMGLYLDRHGSHTTARHYFETALSQDKDNAGLGVKIAETYLAEGEYTAAEVWLLSAADMAPEDPQVWETLARYYVDLGIGAEESGLLAARRLMELRPENAIAHDLMGWSYFLANQDDLARTSLNQALALDPTLASAHYHLGRLNARQGRFLEADWSYRLAAGFDVEGRLATLLERSWEDLPGAVQDQP
jgi:tetratricopeptide (TPR) repeat protein